MASPATKLDKARRAVCRAAALCAEVVTDIKLVRDDTPPHSAKGIGLSAKLMAADLAVTHLRRAAAVLVAAGQVDATANSIEQANAIAGANWKGE